MIRRSATVHQRKTAEFFAHRSQPDSPDAERVKNLISWTIFSTLVFHLFAFQTKLSLFFGLLDVAGFAVERGETIVGRPEAVVELRDAAKVLRDSGLNARSLLKVDIEGAEYEVFMNAGNVLRERVIRRIVLEIHNSILERRGVSGEELHRFLIGCGYALDDSLGHWVYVAGA